MGFALLMALQTASASPVVDPIRFDLARHRPAAQGCSRATGSDILVCGQRVSGAPYPMAEMERRYAPRKIRAEMSLGGSTVRAFTEAVEFPRGNISKRIMVGIKFPF
jgi:hypothetical protein